ncbi:MAG TPA: O-antigen ligase family protein [Chloroflexia bacterium]|nr:O-antigen ligase family protein [Chloroflexia bacterium]
MSLEASAGEPVDSTNHPPNPAAIQDYKTFLTSEPAILAAMLLTLGLYYLVPSLPVKAFGGLAFFALTVYRPDLHLVMVPLTAPLFYRQQAIQGLYFPLPEIVIVTGVAAWIVRDGWSLIRTRRLPWLRELIKQPGTWLAAALLLIGTLWLLVPEEAGARSLALREFRWTVLEPVLFFALILRWLRAERDIWRMVGAWLIAAALVGREGVQQFLFGQTWSMEGVGRVSSVLPSATAFGIYLGRPLALGIVLAIFIPARWRNWKIATALLSAVMALGVLLSFTRGAWIGVFVALASVAIITRYRVLIAAIGAALLAGLALLPFVRAERITSMFDFSTQDNTGLARGKIWGGALNILHDHPFTGIGQDQFLYADPKYGVPQLRFFEVSHPHNWVLDFWLRLGIPGLAWIFVALGYFFWQSLKLWRSLRGTALGALTLGLIASMIDFAVHGLLDMAYFTMDLALTFWLTMGLFVAIKKHQHSQASADAS